MPSSNVLPSLRFGRRFVMVPLSGSKSLLTSEVLFKEFFEIHPKATVVCDCKLNPTKTYHTSVAKLGDWTKKDAQSALCLSGGGIRSAAFALGVIQGLAEKDLIKHFHYLSTVSGGGYIGSWISAWRTRCGWAAMLEGLKNFEACPLKRLLKYQTYLTPKAGLGSADTWAAIAGWLRNLVLNWAVLIPLLCALTTLPRILHALVNWDMTSEFAARYLSFAAIVLPIVVFLISWSLVKLSGCKIGTGRLGPLLRWFGGPPEPDRQFEFLILIPIVAYALLTTSLMARYGLPGNSCIRLQLVLVGTGFSVVWRIGAWVAFPKRAAPLARWELASWVLTGMVGGLLLCVGAALLTPVDSDRWWVWSAARLVTMVGPPWVIGTLVINDFLLTAFRTPFRVRSES